MKDWEIADLGYILEWMTGLTDVEFERAVRTGKLAFLGLVINLDHGKLTRLARKERAALEARRKAVGL